VNCFIRLENVHLYATAIGQFYYIKNTGRYHNAVKHKDVTVLYISWHNLAETNFGKNNVSQIDGKLKYGITYSVCKIHVKTDSQGKVKLQKGVEIHSDFVHIDLVKRFSQNTKSLRGYRIKHTIMSFIDGF
jgi:archaellum component FlaG (FlaF/FlaG flagellin family)